jgi:anti-anti-sigma factor
MAITIRVDQTKKEATLILTERLTFDQRKMFSEAYRSLNGDFSRYVLDMGRLEYLDSAALGMLLHFKEHLKGKSITILASQGTVSEVLRVSRFDKLFDLRVA